MNYRHAFHAGNFADVLKHAVLASVISYLQQKPGAIRVIESHAGGGLYDLGSLTAARTSEWRDGIGLLADPLDAKAEAVLTPFRDALSALRAGHGPNIYPGSPLICQQMLRADDRYIGAELHGETNWQLKTALNKDKRFKVLLMDGWQVLRANVPPKERRGVVLVDPAFEAADEWQVTAREVIAAWRKWQTGCFIVWYPLKNPRQADDLARDFRDADVVNAVRLELIVDDLAAAEKLAGCGLIVINPPWTLRDQAEALLPALALRLARSRKAGFRCEVIAG
ncbi:MAG: 23S rRNA (adenine(2030)-N(6))-methyltransferase RlmJ [Hyphomicrobiales bacterium]|nr:23S rRNA (adenine(2030)-N(6))-methyltransferase RlmJ [Hyphomicrobiales bacterium]